MYKRRELLQSTGSSNIKFIHLFRFELERAQGEKNVIYQVDGVGLFKNDIYHITKMDL